MSTRGVFGFVNDGKEKLSYNHSDSYPEGLGVDVLGQLKKLSLSSLRGKVAKIEMVNQGDKPTYDQIARCSRANTVDLNVSERSTSDWYCLLRRAQGDLATILKVGLMIDAGNFPLESLFCEWGYIINLDTMKLEVYKGFNHGKRSGTGWTPEHTEGRYATKLDTDDNKHRTDRDEAPYFGIWLVTQFSLIRLPAEKTFLSRIDALTKEKETA